MDSWLVHYRPVYLHTSAILDELTLLQSAKIEVSDRPPESLYQWYERYLKGRTPNLLAHLCALSYLVIPYQVEKSNIVLTGTSNNLIELMSHLQSGVLLLIFLSAFDPGEQMHWS